MSKPNERRLYRPIPELLPIKQRKVMAWTLKDTQLDDPAPGRTDKRRRVMESPHGPEGIGISRHELGHALWSPVAPPDVDFDADCVQAFEDVRINLWLERIGLPVDEPRTPEHIGNVRRCFAADLTRGDVAWILKRAMACIGAPSLDPVVAEAVATVALVIPEVGAFHERWDRRARTVFGPGRMEVFTTVMAEAERFARELADLLGELAESEPPPSGRPGEGEGDPGDGDADDQTPPDGDEHQAGGEAEAGRGSGSAESELREPTVSEGLAETLRQQASAAAQAARARLLSGGTVSLGGESLAATPAEADGATALAMRDETEARRYARAKAVRDYEASVSKAGVRRLLPQSEHTRFSYGEATLVNPPLTRVSPSARAALGRSVKSRPEGSIPTRMDRYMIDGAVFRAVGKRRQSATILQDVSGSMSLSTGEIDALCVAASGRATVATYSGSGTRGELRVVAKGYRRCLASQYRARGMGGNVVDMVALEWLAKQPGRRIWVSDAMVTGHGDCHDAGMVGEAIRFCDDHSIAWVLSPDDAVALLDGDVSVLPTGHRYEGGNSPTWRPRPFVPRWR